MNYRIEDDLNNEKVEFYLVTIDEDPTDFLENHVTDFIGEQFGLSNASIEWMSDFDDTLSILDYENGKTIIYTFEKEEL